MYRQGRSLGRQIGKACGKELVVLVTDFSKMGYNVWFLGRDCFALYSALKKEHRNVRYLKGLNRVCTRELSYLGLLEEYLKEQGVKAGDLLVDSGFRGSIFDQIKTTKLGRTLSFALLSCENTSYYSFNVKRSIVLALEHSPKPEVVEWNAATRRPVVHKLPNKGFREDCCCDRRETADGLDKVSEFVSGFVTGFNERKN